MTCDLEHPMESPTGRSPRVCLMCFPCHVLWPTPSSISAVVVCHVLCPITRPMDYPMAYFPWFHGVSRGMPQGTPHDVTQGYLFYTLYAMEHANGNSMGYPMVSCSHGVPHGPPLVTHHGFPFTISVIIIFKMYICMLCPRLTHGTFSSVSMENRPRGIPWLIPPSVMP